MTQLKDLVARLRMDSAQFGAGMRDARGQAGSLASHMRAALIPVAGAIAAAFSARALWQGISQGGAEIDRVAKSARAAGGTIGGFRAVETAAGEAGVAVETLRQQVQNMDRQISSGRADAALRALGLAAADLAAMDVDTRLATVADRMRELGMDTGAAMAVLQQLGVENRDMALLMTQGGEAIRAARRDVEDYGLSLSSIDAAAVERANDQIGRLAVAGQYLRQELASAVLPVLGELAQRLSDSMREGGGLRMAIDGLVAVASAGVQVFDVFARIIAAVGGAMWDTARGAFAWAAGLIGIEVPARNAAVAADDVTIAQDALSAAMGVFHREASPKAAAGAINAANAYRQQAAAARDAAASEIALLRAEMERRRAEAPQWIKDAVGNDFVAPDIAGNIAAAESALARAQAALDEANRRARETVREVTGSMSETMTDAVIDLGEIKVEVEGLSTALGGLGGGGRAAVDSLREGLSGLKDVTEDVKSTMQTAFVGLITGAQSLRQALANVLAGFAQILANRAFERIWGGGGGGGGGLGGIMGRLFSFDGGGRTPIGPRLGGLDGRGGMLAMVHPNETVIDHSRGQSVGGGMSVSIGFEDMSGFTAFVRDQAGRVVASSRKSLTRDAVGAAIAYNSEYGFR